MLLSRTARARRTNRTPDGSEHYSAANPYAVRMVVHTGMTPAVESVFARDLLTEGVRGPAGLTDVQIWPAPRGPQRPGISGDTVRIRLSTPAGTTTLSVPTVPLRRFLAQILEQVPVGAENSSVAVDNAIASWLLARLPEGGAD
ncbi:SsgA family sporulation/cell division regulator [Streptomyces sp. NPDC089424]|uniref:SsgA family sporulation/cell division regulator n=1 Tax=Streptomyces sp. NPDC089424 TaxID=3365917 RepID=UPI00381156E3